MKKRVLFSLIAGLIFQTCALAQIPGYGWSSISVDSGSGLITAEGYATLDDPTEDWATVSIYTSLSTGGSDNETDNCGQGCASSWVTGQVSQLGTVYSEWSNFSGWVFYDEGESDYWNPPGDIQSYNVPSAPDIQLQSINAIDPHNVVWDYSISGVLPYSAAFALGNILILTNPVSSDLTFTADQDAYPPSDSPDPNFKTAQIVGWVYGLPFGGTWCPVNYTKNITLSDSFNGTRFEGGDGIANQWINIVHVVAYRFSTVQYCIQPYAGSALTELVQASGTIDTRNNSANADTDIAQIVETNNYLGQSDNLGPIFYPTSPSQGPQFQSLEMWYGWSPGPNATVGPSEWFQPGQQGAICNQATLINAPGGIYSIIPTLGCMNENWP